MLTMIMLVIFGFVMLLLVGFFSGFFREVPTPTPSAQQGEVTYWDQQKQFGYIDNKYGFNIQNIKETYLPRKGDLVEFTPNLSNQKHKALSITFIESSDDKTHCQQYAEITPTTSSNQPKDTVVFKIRPLLNASEQKVFKVLIQSINTDNSRKYRVFSQVSLGEVFKTNKADNAAFLSQVNSKRSDFCITDLNFMPMALIEYNGDGHYQNNYAKRDAQKRNAAQSAGIIYHEITSVDANDLKVSIIEELLPKLEDLLKKRLTSANAQ